MFSIFGEQKSALKLVLKWKFPGVWNAYKYWWVDNKDREFSLDVRGISSLSQVPRRKWAKVGDKWDLRRLRNFGKWWSGWGDRRSIKDNESDFWRFSNCNSCSREYSAEPNLRRQFLSLRVLHSNRYEWQERN